MLLSNKPLFLHEDYDSYFFNRKNDIKKIKYQINAVKESLPQQLLLVGYRGVGKTYLLKKIMNELDQSIICTYIDILQILSLQKENLSIEDILIDLLDNMNSSINNKDYSKSIKSKIILLIDKLKLNDYDFNDCAELFKIPIPKSETNYKKLAKFVMEFPQHVVDTVDGIKGFVIIIDEFQMLDEMNHLDKFFGLIRSFNQLQHNVSYIFTGSISASSEIIDFINGESSAFGSRLQQITIKPFSKEETRAYFNECMSEINFTEDGFDRFYKCTQGIPLYINSFYNVMDSNVCYNEDVVKDAFFSNMEQILFKWVKIWSTLSDNEKVIVKTLADEDNLSWTVLLNKSGRSRSTFNKYLNTLINKGILKHYGGKYSISEDMLKIWLKHEKEIYGFYPL